MGQFNLNLSTRPFPAYRVASLALLLFFVVISGVTLWQLYSFRQYSSLAKSIREKEEAARLEKGSLANKLGDLSTRLDRPVTKDKLAEIDFLNNLIVRKHFSWTTVFANLEGVIPDNVHLTTVTPEILKDKVSLRLEIICRSISDESEFIRRLQASSVFQDVVVSREERKGTGGSGDVGVDLTVTYFPEKAASDVALVPLPQKTSAPDRVSK
jgi:Fimbrial assembly protein (PilN)